VPDLANNVLDDYGPDKVSVDVVFGGDRVII
jgi:hypothetical protein